jgi:Tfp pilus assembly protein PilO
MRLKPREKRVLALGLVAACGIVGWLYVVAPMQERWRRVTTRLATRQSDLENLRRAAGERTQYGDLREKIGSMVFETSDLEASQRVIPAFINQVEGLGQRRHIQITRYEPLPAKIEESYAVYSLRLTFRSSLPDLVEFLIDMQEARPIITVRRAHVTPPGPNAETLDFTTELLLSTFAIERATEEQEGTATTSVAEADIG